MQSCADRKLENKPILFGLFRVAGLVEVVRFASQRLSCLNLTHSARMSSFEDPATHEGPRRTLERVKSAHILALSGAVHLGLVLYAQQVDTHPERYGGLKYTDVDWRVVVDGARHMWRPTGEAEGAAGVASGLLSSVGVSIGE